ncbi:Gfo/Idh/MocA family oxidoreductase [Heyndrickxia oleronia]|uniref:Gfo/Idh/MocA family protein n=1 Tax=Heyndrickxia oleronia TaxID=38875 RepID=UPI002040CDA2|nr:Gfo/Idh/MocA family oxidoreductase [Heyndrickxia oleronia]MCM3236587.1 Gfo/Idh/MocA family oxidoreductase [Heyndrickxia oleronia]
MLKIGIIGLGDIANKAYLPVLSSLENIEIHLYTRNQIKLKNIQEKYRFKKSHESLSSLITSGITGAFVHSATESHEEIIEKLLENNIHVYVDKPITYNLESTEKLLRLAEKNKLILTAGFNRRFAPSYQNLKELSNPNMIIMQKNRQNLPEDNRKFIFDDFIHVADTLLYMFPYPIEDIVINGRKQNQLLYHVVIQLISKYGTAIGIMNRDSGTNEEKLEIMNSEEKRVVTNVADLIIRKDRNETRIGYSDWEQTLYKRGFEQAVADFIHAIEYNHAPSITKEELVKTHELCEMIVNKIAEI